MKRFCHVIRLSNSCQISQAPRLVHGLLDKVLKRYSSQLESVGRHLGIAMTFFEGQDWSRSTSQLRDQVRHSIDSLKSAGKIGGFHVIRGPKVELMAGRSEHVGSLDSYRNLHRDLQVSSAFFERYDGMIPIDTCALPEVPAGPHTFVAAVLARQAVRALISL